MTEDDKLKILYDYIGYPRIPTLHYCLKNEVPLSLKVGLLFVIGGIEILLTPQDLKEVTEYIHSLEKGTLVTKYELTIPGGSLIIDTPLVILKLRMAGTSIRFRARHKYNLITNK